MTPTNPPAGKSEESSVITPEVRLIISELIDAMNNRNPQQEPIRCSPYFERAIRASHSAELTTLRAQLAEANRTKAAGALAATEEFARLSADRDALAVQVAKLREALALEPKWIVNNLGELGVEIHGRCFFLYKGGNIEYVTKESGIADADEDGLPILYRCVGKREFGETQWPASWIKAGRREDKYTVETVYTPGLSDGPPDNPDYKWKPIPNRAALTATTAPNLVAIDRDELEGLKTVAHAVSVLSKAMLDDPDFAWSWHCNIAMPIVDASGGAIGHADANKLATALMRHLFGVTTKEPTAPAAPNLVAIDRDKLEALRRDVQRLEAVRLAALGEIAYDAEPASEKYVTGTIQRAHRILSTGEPDGILKTAAIDSASVPRKGTP